MPLAYRVHRRLVRHRVATNNLKRLNRAVRGNPGVQFYAAFFVKLFREMKRFENGAASRTSTLSCDASLPGVVLVLQETGAALAGM